MNAPIIVFCRSETRFSPLNRVCQRSFVRVTINSSELASPQDEYVIGDLLLAQKPGAEGALPRADRTQPEGVLAEIEPSSPWPSRRPVSDSIPRVEQVKRYSTGRLPIYYNSCP
jgi:hypothetical protein